jgi:hypothetical protein
MQAKVDLVAVYKAYFAFVEAFFARRFKSLSAAEVADIKGQVWVNVVRGWPTPPPPNPEGWFTKTTKNAVFQFFRDRKLKKRDFRKTCALDEDHDTGLVDGHMTADDDPPVEIERVRTAKRLRLIATKLAPKEYALFCQMMRDWHSVPSRKRKRVAAAIGLLLRIDETRARIGRPLSEDSQVGHAVRDLDLDEAA